jgi:tetratricopeptide (TPR) repeat protein
MSYSDKKLLNQMWEEYLQMYFYDELYDTTCDIKELQYAQALYNLHNPRRALRYLYPEENEYHLLYSIICKYACGDYAGTINDLEEYVKHNNYHAINLNISTMNLIWCAEVVGRFDIATRLDKIISDTKSDYNTNPAYLLNLAHISLYDNELSEAQNLYVSALNSAESLGYKDTTGYNQLYDYLKSDLHVFSRFCVIPDSTLQRLADMMGIDFTPAFVPISCVDSTESARLYEQLEGNWICQDGDVRIELHVDAKYHLFTYTAFDAKGNECNKSLAEVRIGRINNELYWDEFGTTTNSNSLGKIICIDDNCFVLEIIENGNPSDKGKLRKYERVE